MKLHLTAHHGKHYHRKMKYKTNPEAHVYRFRDAYDNLLYNILIQAARDNDVEYLRHGDGLAIWHYLRGVKHV